MKRLIIIGAGGFGREVLQWALDCEKVQNEWKVTGFLDDNFAALDGYDCSFPILGDTSSYQIDNNDRFICAVGNPTIKLKLCTSLKDRGGIFTTLIHPSAYVGDRCVLGIGCILSYGALLTTDVKLGNFVTINVYTTVGHDVIIDDGCTLSAHCDVTGFARLERGVFLGTHASILPGGKIGEQAVVGAGSVVLRKVPAGATVMGVPAKQIAGFS